VKRTLFQHEARVLRILRCHPVIPLVYAFGRFENIPMELLGPTIGNIKGQAVVVRMGIAPQLAVQMVHAPSLYRL